MNNELTAALATIEKCREITNCQDGVDLQDWVKQLAAENVGLNAAFDKPQAYLSWHAIPSTWDEPLPCGEYLDVHDTDGHKNSDGTDCWPVYAKPEIETPATDAYLAGIKADGVSEFIASLPSYGYTEVDTYDDGVKAAIETTQTVYGPVFIKQLREGADK